MIKKYKNNRISLKIFWPAAFLFTIAFIFASYNLSKVILYDYPSNDFSDHLAQIKSTYEYGLNKPIPYWNNGNFYAGKIYGISWYYTGALINHVTKNPRISFLILQASLFIIGFIGIYLFGKIKKYSLDRIILFYILFFFSPLTVAYFLGLGSVGVLYGYALLFFVLTIIEKYKKNKVDWKFFLIIPLFFVIIISHMYIAIITSMILCSFFLYKSYFIVRKYSFTKKKLGNLFNSDAPKTKKNFWSEIVIIFVSIFTGWLLSIFWWKDYITGYELVNKTLPPVYNNLYFMQEIAPRGMIFTFVIPIFFLFIHY